MPKSIEISHLTKKFTFPVKSEKAGWVKNLFAPEHREVVAVSDISFSVDAGERVAFIGPNGAGKSTTIKMLTGILFPTSGKMNVLGFDPTKERKQLAYQIGTVFGSRRDQPENRGPSLRISRAVVCAQLNGGDGYRACAHDGHLSHNRIGESR